MYAFGGVPVYDDANIAWVNSLGATGDMPWMEPYEGSIQVDCEVHGGKMWLGPEQQAKHTSMLLKHEPFMLICLICYATMCEGKPAMRSLSNKTSTIFTPGQESSQTTQ